ncbi:hypothetical protein KFE25_004356 [Diacronema lutheri]|uniref:Uncharacterized protein n=2 Tax=Diacronema lutheri TaxID=2081491 RepID=A0A8J5X3I9_DIALT|nr:hypothetical protein KFE25_004356 [Diacronema lutheri]
MDADEPEPIEALALDRLVLELREAIVELLAPGRDRICAAGTCTALRAAVARADARLARFAPFETRTRLRAPAPIVPLLPRFAALRTLALVGHATDALLAGLADVEQPSLAELDVSQSAALTDAGVLALLAQTAGRHAGPWRRLRVLDLTFCSRTTYGLVIELRARFDARPLVVRRLPSWLQGMFITPWGESHTYFADGSFTFDRTVQAAGYVRWLAQVRPPPALAGAAGSRDERALDARPFLTDSLQYIDFVPPPAWPPWMKFVYRPGVALCPRPPCAGADGAARHVLVAQLLRGLRAPTALPPLPVDAVPIGGRVYYKRSGVDGERVRAAETVADAEEAEAADFEMMVSCMPVVPLDAVARAARAAACAAAAVAALPGAPGLPGLSDLPDLSDLSDPNEEWRWLMPPTELVSRIRSFEGERARQGLPEEMLERVITAAFSAEPGAVAAAQDDSDSDEGESDGDGGAHGEGQGVPLAAIGLAAAAAPTPAPRSGAQNGGAAQAVSIEPELLHG